MARCSGAPAAGESRSLRTITYSGSDVGLCMLLSRHEWVMHDTRIYKVERSVSGVRHESKVLNQSLHERLVVWQLERAPNA